jgi:regulator of replication initiation timing
MKYGGLTMRVLSRSGITLLCSFAALLTSGCVSSGTYQAKEQESLQLSRNLENSKNAQSELLDKNKKLLEENDALSLKLKNLNADFTGLKAENDKLKSENDKLVTAIKPENLLKALVDTFSNLQAENNKLKQALDAAEKASQKKETDPPVQLTPVIAKPGVISSGGGADKPKEPTVELK